MFSRSCRQYGGAAHCQLLLVGKSSFTGLRPIARIYFLPPSTMHVGSEFDHDVAIVALGEPSIKVQHICIWKKGLWLDRLLQERVARGCSKQAT
jgi:hypothetical protein